MELSRQRSLAASAALHLGVVGAMLISWPWAKDLKVGTVVPVNIVTNAPTTDVRQAVEAPEEQAAQTEDPVPDAPMEAVAPEPTPVPTPPKPQPAPQPTPKPTPAPKTPTPPPPKPTPTPAPKTPAPKTPPAKTPPTKAAEKSLDLDSLMASLSKGSKSSAQKGPARPETATQARPAVGSGVSANALAGLSEELQRRWNPNCDVEGGRDVRVRVTFTIGSSGAVTGQVSAGGQENSSNPVVRTAAERAIAAVYGASPFRTLPRDFYGERVAVNFNAREACS